MHKHFFSGALYNFVSRYESDFLHVLLDGSNHYSNYIFWFMETMVCGYTSVTLKKKGAFANNKL